MHEAATFLHWFKSGRLLAGCCCPILHPSWVGRLLFTSIYARLRILYTNRYINSQLSHFHATNLVDVNCTVTVINQLRLPPMLLMTPHIPSPAHNADHRGGLTQIFGGRASKPETSRPVEKRNFPIRSAFWRLRCGWYQWNFVEIFCVIQLQSLGYTYSVVLIYNA